jgi:hypothetical protein
VSTFSDPNRESVGLPPIWTGAGETEPETPPEGGGGEQVEPTFDPSAHTVDEVNAYLAEHPDERDAVLEAERAGKGRVGVLGE